MITQRGKPFQNFPANRTLVDCHAFTEVGMESFHVPVVRHCFEYFAAVRADFCFLRVYVGLVVETGEVVAADPSTAVVVDDAGDDDVDDNNNDDDNNVDFVDDDNTN